MLERDFYIVWKGSLSKRWRTLGEDMAKIAWNQHHSKLVSIPDDACKNACEKLVCDAEMKYAPKIDDIIKRIVHESRPKAKNLVLDEAEGPPISPEFHRELMAYCRVMCGTNDQHKLEAINMLPGIFRKYNEPLHEDTVLELQKQKSTIQARMKAEAPKRKAEAAHAEKLTKAEWIARLKRKRAENSTLGNALKGVLK